jgi:hypothetical protein
MRWAENVERMEGIINAYITERENLKGKEY